MKTISRRRIALCTGNRRRSQWITHARSTDRSWSAAAAAAILVLNDWWLQFDYVTVTSSFNGECASRIQPIVHFGEKWNDVERERDTVKQRAAVGDWHSQRHVQTASRHIDRDGDRSGQSELWYERICETAKSTQHVCQRRINTNTTAAAPSGRTAAWVN